ncbi:MAG: beta-galactosidase [Candidatus Eremiobacteraeota bacterium]|nr:beta-galactosidase [Candidatus Eremiobacteraeota bacterium]
MSFAVRNSSFYLDGTRTFLLSGEVHYFRIRRELWDRHLDAAADAGLRTVSSYVPWAWHEPEEGVFDFSGDVTPERDLLGWIERCKAHGLTCIVKPGPFILAEFRGAGLPDWFLDRYGPRVKMRTRGGTIVAGDGVSLFNKEYLEKVGRWYDRIMPLISRSQDSAGGPIIMMQVCNEIGVFSWLAHQADYGNAVQERFIAYLKRRFSAVNEMNGLWGTAFADFDSVELPQDGMVPYQSRGEKACDYEWHCFWRTCYGDYLRLLCTMARERGVTVPVYHNLPGWIFGSGYDFPVNITMYDDLFSTGSEILFGIDHIPEFQSHRNFHDDRIINDIVSAKQAGKPLFAAEFQCGSREHHVETSPREMELFYKASIANGLKGWNYYMFSQGRNVRHKGHSGGTFYWFTPLTPEAGRTSAFPLVRRMNRMIKTLEPLIVEASRKAEIAVLFYSPYYASELGRPVPAASGLMFNAWSIRRPAFFDGLLRILQVLNIEYDMLDLGQAAGAAMSRYRQVWAFCTDEMNAPEQQKLLDYTSAGGQLVIFPCLPDRELSQKPCTLIREAFGAHPDGAVVMDSPLIDVYEHLDVRCASPILTYSGESLNGAEIVARTLNGSVCGLAGNLGKGSFIHLGTWLGFDTEGHKPVYEKLLGQSGARLQQAASSTYHVTVRERFTPDKSALLFAANYYNEEHTGKVTYTHPGNGEIISLPYSQKEMPWPPLYAVLSPLCLSLAEGISLLHCTSDLLSIDADDNQIVMTLFGDRDLEGELVLEGPQAGRVKTATLDGRPPEMSFPGHRVVIRYSHLHKKEMILSLELS